MNLSTKSEKELEFQDTYLARELFGPQERNLDLLRNKLGVEVNTRGTKLVLTSEDEKYLDVACNYLIQIYELLRAGHSLHQKDMDHALDLLNKNPRADLKSLFAESVFAVSPKKTLSPKTLGQREYIQLIRERELVFGIGPAGTGKTFLAGGSKSGLIHAREILANLDEIGFVEFQNQDVIRNELVAKIVRAYEEQEENK